MSKILIIILISAVVIVLLLFLLFLYACFKISEIEEKDFNFYDDDIDEK